MGTTETPPLVKEHLAERLKAAIVEGRLRAGERVVEGAWAREFGAAQASVREAINLLILDGFLVKNSGRSARVPRYTTEDISRIFEVRGALEGLAAQLAAQACADLSRVEAALFRMEAAMTKGDVKELIDSDLNFHLALGEASGNPLLADMLGRLLRPLFTFILLRTMETHEGTANWVPDLPRHREMIYLMRESDPALAGRFVQHCVGRFVASARAVWLPEAKPKRSRRS